ncbi:hypothetical protein [Dietzia sp. PP-33]|uniref:hypothetical protein n=1 Tax=Dietzia sp. PP-33 TaxID=2957500 RepID=UPI0029B07334|nr:hypothetical protein [Dietzia sp. PP-33]MDX2359066.1 hypothetical protein [Dietzia sp. PP-33]
MRRAYIDSHLSLVDAYREATRWAEAIDCVIGPSTAAIERSPWLERSGIPLGVASNRHTRFTARPHGLVVAWCLNLEEILELEHRNQLSGVVAVQAPAGLRPWVAAHNVEHIGEDALETVPAVPPSIKALVKGITSMAVTNQGLTDKRERSEAIQALTYFHTRGHHLDPLQLTLEAIRNDWPGQAPIELAQIAHDVRAGRQLRHSNRIDEELLAEWANAA